MFELRRGSKTTRSPASSSPSKKVKEDDISVEENYTKEEGNKNDEEVEEVQEEERTQEVITEEETTLEDDDLEQRIENIRRPRPKTMEPNPLLDKDKEINNLKRLLAASGEVIATLEDENNHLNAKAEFYEEVAEGLVIENESLLLRLKHKEELKTQKNNRPANKSVSFDLEPEEIVSETEDGEGIENNDEVEEVEDEERTTGVVPDEETGFRQHSGRVTCIVCGLTRNTKSQMTKHMEIHKEEGEFVPAGQIHCGLTAFPNCPFQCYANEELVKHIETDHKRHKCNLCSETFETKEGMDKHRRKTHPSFKPCRNMSDCSYGTRCHYSHEPLKKAFRCYQCGEEFNNRGEMMIHVD